MFYGHVYFNNVYSSLLRFCKKSAKCPHLHKGRLPRNSDPRKVAKQKNREEELNKKDKTGRGGKAPGGDGKAG